MTENWIMHGMDWIIDFGIITQDAGAILGVKQLKRHWHVALNGCGIGHFRTRYSSLIAVLHSGAATGTGGVLD